MLDFTTHVFKLLADLNDIANPANPISPLSPANPSNPASPINLIDDGGFASLPAWFLWLIGITIASLFVFLVWLIFKEIVRKL